MECRTAAPPVEPGLTAPVLQPTGARSGPMTHPSAFEDNFEHLQALEKESKLLLAAAFLSRNPVGEIGRVFPFLPQAVSLEETRAAMLDLVSENREREEISIRRRVELNFVAYINEMGLDHFERTVLMLLLMRVASPDFNAMFEKCGFEDDPWVGCMEIGTLLSVISPGLRDQLVNRRYFSIHSTLEREEIIQAADGGFEGADKILGKHVFLDKPVLRRLLGDNNHYSASFRFLREAKCGARLEQVILPEGIKEETVSLVGDYLKNRDTGALQKIDSFFAYGTGLTLLFYGASGTGKTLLAQALACGFGRPLFSVLWEDLEKGRMTSEEVLAVLFREAELRGGIVFLDECDDVFENSSHRSRALLVEIEKARCVVILATNRPIDLDPALERRIAMKVHFPMPDAEMRLKLWKALIPDTVALAEDVDLARLAENYQFSGGLIKNCVLLATAKSMQAEGNATPVLTREMLEYAADLQKSSLTEELVTGSPYSPSARIDSLPLRRKQREELARIAPAWAEQKSRGKGLHLLVCSSSLSVGLLAADALANECRLKVRKFPLSCLLAVPSEEDRIVDPVTQRELTPLEYAFTRAPGETYMTLFADDESMLDLSPGKNRQAGEDLFFSRFFAKLRAHNGLTCTVCPTARMSRLPAEFDLGFFLQPPSEEMQIRQWEARLGENSHSDEDLIELVERHPMHPAEMDEIVKRAWICAFMRKGKGEIDLSDVYETIARCRCSKDVPLLFGGKIF
ncbi:MAG: ATP-binding protein [Syntrophobacteraceae bacterium]